MEDESRDMYFHQLQLLQISGYKTNLPHYCGTLINTQR
jgi:hypothetical protein